MSIKKGDTPVVRGLVATFLALAFLITGVWPHTALAAVTNLNPNGSGALTQLSLVGAPTNWQACSSSDGDTSYVYSFNSNTYSTDLYNLPDPGLNGTINSVTVYMEARTTSTGQSSARTAIRTHATNYFGTAVTLTTSYATYSTTRSTNPNTNSAWTWTEVNDLQAGVSLRRTGAGTLSRCTHVWVVVDYTPLTVTINQAAGQTDPTNSSPINFTVVFSESVSDFATGDVMLSGTAGAITANVTGSGTTYNVAVSGMTSNGTVIATIAAGVAHNAVGTPNEVSTSTDNTVIYDTTPPTVTLNQAAGQADPTSCSPINFTIVFSESVADFATGDVMLSGTAGATTGNVTGSGTTYNVAVSGMTTNGTVIATIDAGVAHDAAGNPNTASTSTDNTVTYDTTASGVLPIHETFMNSTAPGWILGGTPTAYLTSGNGDPAGQGWLRLTTTGSDQAGYAYYNTAFPSNQGILVIFEYVAWGGTGADGLGFFLFDGCTPTFRIGDAGGSLGYANGCGNITGLSNAYVGIGVDEWGNFAAYDTARCHHGYIGQTPDSVTIRGSGNGDSSAIYDYYYLANSGTLAQGIDIPGQSQRPDVSGANYRKVVMVLTPDQKMTIKMQFGAGNPLTTLIDGYDLAAAPYQADVPATFKIGYFGATGGSSNYHELRNVTVTSLTDLALTKVVDDPTPCEGGNITYTLRVDNNGPSDATNVQVEDRLPGNVTYVSHNPSQGNYNSSTGLWTVGNVTNGGNATLQIAATVNAGTGGMTITNTGNITYCDQGDSVPSNDSDTADIIVRVSPVATASSNSPVCEGGNVTLTGGPDGMSSYSWTGPAGFSSTDQSPVRTPATTDRHVWHLYLDCHRWQWLHRQRHHQCGGQG